MDTEEDLQDIESSSSSQIVRTDSSGVRRRITIDKSPRMYMTITETSGKPVFGLIKFLVFLYIAIFVDIIEILLIETVIGGTVVDLLATGLFFFLFKKSGVSFKRPSRAVTFFGTALLEAIPGLDFLPMWTIDIILMYIMLRGKTKDN